MAWGMRGADAVLQVCSSKRACRQVQDCSSDEACRQVQEARRGQPTLVPLAESWLLQSAAKHTQHPPTRRHHAPSRSAWPTFHDRGRGRQCGRGPTLRGRTWGRQA